jgi:hypothetical protein
MSLTNELNRMFTDLRKAKQLSNQISLTLFLERPTDEDYAAFALLLKTINGIKVPELEFMLDEDNIPHQLFPNGEDDDLPRA